jgi:hypothetical protein
MQLNVIALQLGCQCRFPMQISINKLMFKWVFHSSINKQNSLTFITNNLKLMHDQIIVL